MATATKTTATKKETVKAKPQTTVTKTAVVEEVAEVKATREVRELKKFESEDLIMCRSITAGELLLPGKKTGLLYTWANYGDTQEVEFQDLQALRSLRSKYLYEPLFIIEDEELLENPQWSSVKDVYDNLFSQNDLEEIFLISDINQFKHVIANLPNGAKNTVKSIAAERVRESSLNSLDQIRAIDEILDTDLMILVK